MMQVNSFKKSQANRIFHLIQQTVKQPRVILTADMLEQFLTSIHPNMKIETVKVMHNIDRLGRELNEENFSYSIAQALSKQSANNEIQLQSYHKAIKSLLCNQYSAGLSRVQYWDQNTKLNQQQLAILLQKINVYDEQISPFIGQFDMIMFDTMLPKLNIALSITTINLNLGEEVPERIKKLLKTNLINVLYDSINVKNNHFQLLIQPFRCLCYLYSALKYPQIEQILCKTFLFKVQTWSFLMAHLSADRLEIRILSCVLSSLISKYIKAFNNQLLTNKGFLINICGYIGKLLQNEGIYFAIQFLINIITVAQQANEQWRRENIRIIESIFQFGLQILGKVNQTETQVVCLKLLGECSKVYLMDVDLIKKLNVVNNVFTSNNAELEVAALGLLETFLTNQTQDEFKMIILSQQHFISYLKKNLKSIHDYADLHCLCLQIVYLLTSTVHIKYLFQKDLIAPIMELRDYKHGCTTTIASKILLNVVHNSLSSDWMMAYLHEKGLLICLAELISNCCKFDEYMAIFLDIAHSSEFCYFHKRIFINCLHALYLLGQQNKLHKACRKLFLQYLDISIVVAIQKGLELFFSKNDDKLIFTTLKEEVSIYNAKKQENMPLKIYKLIHFILQQMILDMQDKDIQLLRAIYQLRKFYYHQLYYYFKLYELEIQGIPIYLSINFTLKDRVLQRQIPKKYSLQSLKSYLKDFVTVQVQHDVHSFKLTDTDNKVQLHREEDYRNLVDIIFENFHKTNYMMNLQISNVKEKIDQKQTHNITSDHRFNTDIHQNRRPFRFQNGNNKLKTTQIYNDRSYSPYYGGTSNTSFSKHQYDRNSKSPVMYGQCIECGMRTSNRYRCDICANN